MFVGYGTKILQTPPKKGFYLCDTYASRREGLDTTRNNIL